MFSHAFAVGAVLGTVMSPLVCVSAAERSSTETASAALNVKSSNGINASISGPEPDDIIAT